LYRPEDPGGMRLIMRVIANPNDSATPLTIIPP